MKGHLGRRASRIHIPEGFSLSTKAPAFTWRTGRNTSGPPESGCLLSNACTSSHTGVPLDPRLSYKTPRKWVQVEGCQLPRGWEPGPGRGPGKPSPLIL